ncbi:MAG: sigma-54-dependent Fis family transcriptional regulator [Polyangiaceae bacterium]|nr:sigma-54-dependent Fis family transcriptional regulator [Polyangiaceae bacterium]
MVPDKLSGRAVVLVRCRDQTALLQKLGEKVAHVVLLGVDCTTGDASALERLRGQYADLPVMVVGESPSAATVVQCMRKGAEDFIDPAAGTEWVAAKLQDAAEKHHLAVQVKQLTEVYKRGGKLGELVGISPIMHDIYSRIKSISNTDATVLINGESGTGKELVAHAIHMLSPRSDGAFVPVNCAAIPKDLLESELFGHEKGAFTGADRLHIGSCERSHGGTLFLDEICEMEHGLQSKLLRFLQNHTFTRVGGTDTLEVDSRVIAATNRDPLVEVEKGDLRDDLYYRLNVVPIYIAPLRERPEDIPVLAQHFLSMMCEKYNKYFWDFSPDAVRLLLCYEWPGNVRELRNTVERIVVLANTDRVTPELFPERILKATAKAKVPQLAVDEALECIQKALQQTEVEPEETDEVLPFVEVERRAILGAIKKCDGDISKAARKLGLSRATLYRKLDKYGVR